MTLSGVDDFAPGGARLAELRLAYSPAEQTGKTGEESPPPGQRSAPWDAHRLQSRRRRRCHPPHDWWTVQPPVDDGSRSEVNNLATVSPARNPQGVDMHATLACNSNFYSPPWTHPTPFLVGYKNVTAITL